LPEAVSGTRVKKWDAMSSKICLVLPDLSHAPLPLVVCKASENSSPAAYRKFSSVFTVYSFLFSGIVVE
jgi:hypothetical protein